MALANAHGGGTITFDPAVFPSGGAATIQLQSVAAHGTLELKSNVSSNVPGGTFEVTKRLPENGGEFAYRIKSINEPHERVVRESELTAPGSLSAPQKSRSVKHA